MKILLKCVAVLLSTCSVGFSDNSEILDNGEDSIQSLQNDESFINVRKEFPKSLGKEIDDFTNDNPLIESESDAIEGLDRENSILVPDDTYVDVELGESPQEGYDATLELDPDLEDFTPGPSQLVDIFSEFEDPSTDETFENDDLGLEY